MIDKIIFRAVQNIHVALDEIEDLIERDPRAVKNYRNVERILSGFWASKIRPSRLLSLSEIVGRYKAYYTLHEKLAKQLPEFGTEFERLLERVVDNIDILGERIEEIEDRRYVNYLKEQGII